jgi:hypothetical protein
MVCLWFNILFEQFPYDVFSSFPWSSDYYSADKKIYAVREYSQKPAIDPILNQLSPFALS